MSAFHSKDVLQAIHAWKAAGYSPAQIIDGMGLNYQVVYRELGHSAKRTRVELSDRSAWSGYIKARFVEDAVGRKLSGTEFHAVVVWLDLGFSVAEVARAFRPQHFHGAAAPATKGWLVQACGQGVAL